MNSSHSPIESPPFGTDGGGVNYRSIFDNASHGIFQSTPEGSFTTANSALARLYGAESPEVLIREMTDCPAQHFVVNPVRWAEMRRELLHQGSVTDFEVEVERRDGRTVWTSQNIHAVYDESGSLLYLEGAIFDITERYQRARRQALAYVVADILDESEEVGEVCEAVGKAICEEMDWEMGVIWEVPPTGQRLRCAEVWHLEGGDTSEFEDAVAEAGFAPGVRLSGKVWQYGRADWVVHFSDEAFALNTFVAARYGMNAAFGLPILVGGRLTYVLEFFGAKTVEPDPELQETLAGIGERVGAFISRKQGEAQLRETLQRKGAFFDSALDAIITFDQHGMILEWNPAAERVFGYRRADAIGARLAELILPEEVRHLPSWGLPLEEAEMGFGRRSALRACRENGEEFPAEIAVAKAIRGQRILYTAQLQDASERHRAQWHSLQYTALIDSRPGILFSTTRSGRISGWNRAAADQLGYGARQIDGEPIDLILPREQFDDLRREVEKGEDGIVAECSLRHRNGERITQPVRLLPVRDGRGHLTGLLFLAQETQSVSGEAVQSQKMEAIGRLAGGVAHDFNNILTAILGNTDLILPKATAGTPIYEGLIEIRKASEFASSLTHQLLAFSRGQALELREVDMNDLVHEIDPLLRRLIDEPVRIEVALSPMPVQVTGDEGELEQLLLNLALNARDAMPSGGTLRIETRLLHVTPEQRELGVAPGRWVELVVSDTGMGMSEAVRKHVFEPFFTTKTRGRGTGLGLATCYGIVKHSGGSITCQSVPGMGTRFQILLPAAVKSQLPPLEEGMDEDGHGLILLLEDDSVARSLTADILRQCGYDVLEAETPEAARKIVEAMPEIDLILADPVGSDGRWLEQWLRQGHPSIRLLLTSEDSAVQESPDEDDPFGMAYLRKPFTPFALVHKVRELLRR